MRPRDRMALAAVAAVIVVVGAYLLVLKPKRDDAAELGRQVSAQQAQATTLTGQVAQYQAARRTLGGDLRQLTQVTRAVPVDAAVPSLLRQLERTGRRTKIGIASVQVGAPVAAADAAAPAPGGPGAPGAPADKTKTAPAPATTTPAAATPATTTVAGGAAPPASGVSGLPLTLEFSGSFFDLERFFRRLDRFISLERKTLAAKGRLLSVSSLNLQVGTKGFPKLEAKVGALVYFGGTSAPPATGPAAQ